MSTERVRLTAEQRAQFAKKRRELCGSVIKQPGFEGARVLEHIRGSQYQLQMADGRLVFAAHSRRKDKRGNVPKENIWQLWE
jgi:hypothetical protein